MRQEYKQPSTTLAPNLWDFIALVLVISLVAVLGWGASRMTLPFNLGKPLAISLNPGALPGYALQTTIRMFIALLCSFVFSFIVGTAAAKSRRAGQIIIPLIDILQSVPILGYLSITITVFIALFPNSMMGPECAAIFAVFTSQVWNMTLSFYQSLRTVPKELTEATYMYQLSPWQRFWRLEAPFAMPGLLWNAMVSMSGGWFFIVAAEAISIANQNIMLPGIGSYISVAISHKDMPAIGYAIVTMLIVILLYDQIFFRPLISWSEKFRTGEVDSENANSWLLDLLQRTRLLQYVGAMIERSANAVVNCKLLCRHPKVIDHHLMAEKHFTWWQSCLWYGGLVVVIGAIAWWLGRFIFHSVSLEEAWHVVILGSYTALRVIVLILICSVIWLPVGVWIGMRPNTSKWVQPVIQFLAAFPANLLFPIFVIVIVHFHLNVEIWTAPLMILGTQWYILFNVIAGASTIPTELKLAVKNMQVHGWLKWKRFLLPAVFPYFVTGAITAAGGCWNASIVAEVISWGHEKLIAQGLGAYITLNTSAGHFSKITLGVVVMCLWVMLFNTLFWRKLYNFAAERFALNN
jgi:NitT/TauT family transport system permease protein